MTCGQNLSRFVRHHDKSRTAFNDRIHHLPLVRIGIGKHGVKRRHHRHRDRIEKFQQMRSGRPAINAEFMLNAEDVGSLLIEAFGGDRIGRGIVLINLDADARRITISILTIVHRHHRAFG